MKLGLTGGIGCGKTTVVGIFASLGWHTVESDAIVRRLLGEDASIIDAITKRWGDAVISDQGSVLRPRVAEIVFSDETELLWLEGLLHPAVRDGWIGELKSNASRNCLVEIPLLFEKSLESEFDFTVCIHSPEELVASRMMSRGFTPEEIERRRRNQLPIEEKMRRADYVITNAGSQEFLKEQTIRLVQNIT